ncbi:MAG TPA: hypothetical protein VK524_21990 [Polyangiaceae bacterium]|nr:hypothetical protein [Polyangiaceae bacterium]
MMHRLAPRAYRYHSVAILAAVLAAAAPPSCEEPCDLCKVTNQPKWPKDRKCLTGVDDSSCTNPCEECMREVYYRFGLQCSQSWTFACAQHANNCASACGGS